MAFISISVCQIILIFCHNFSIYCIFRILGQILTFQAHKCNGLLSLSIPWNLNVLSLQPVGFNMLLSCLFLRLLKCHLCPVLVCFWYELFSICLHFTCLFFRFIWIFSRLTFIVMSIYILASRRFWNSANCMGLANIREKSSFIWNIFWKH